MATSAPRSPYQVLGVSPDADQETLRRAYRRRARETHPDTGGSAAEFSQVQQAWEEVSTPEARSRYDARKAREDAAWTDAAHGPSWGAPYPTAGTAAHSSRDGSPQGYWAEFGPSTVWAFRTSSTSVPQQRPAPIVNRMALLTLLLAVVFPPAGVVTGAIALWQLRHRPGEIGRTLARWALFFSVLSSIGYLVPTLLRLFA